MANNDSDANEKYNEKVLTTGAWIDGEFLEEVLTASLHDETKVLDFKVSAAVGAGDNYLSILYKTLVRYTKSGSNEPLQRHLMIKGEPTAQILLNMIEEMGVFNKEAAMYNKTLPAMHRYLKQYFMPESPWVAPMSYTCSRPRTIVMEDIGASGYKMANRRDQLDLDHCLITLRTLARFHALSVKLYQDDPELVMSVAGDLYTESNREQMSKFLNEIFPVLATVLESWEEAARFSPVVKEIGLNVWDKIMHVVKPSEGFNVLNHGDMWVNNTMYMYDEDGHVASAKLVDFQLCRYTTPATDLHYFLFTSPKPEVLSEHMQEMLLAYHRALTADLTMLGQEVEYSFEQLEQDMLDRAVYAFLTMAQILPIVVAPPSELYDLDNMSIEDLENVSPENHPLMKNYKNAYYRETAVKLLSHMEACGYLAAARDLMVPLVEAKGEVNQPEEASSDETLSE